MKENKQSRQKQPQVNEDLPATVFEGRAVKAELSDIYDLLTDYADDAKQQLMDGVEPFEILVQLLDDLDHTKFLCTVPVGYVSKELAKALLYDGRDDEEDEYEYDDCDDDEGEQQLYVYSSGRIQAAEYIDED
ncbi:MAG: hypothetical protein HFE29_00820 [Clostridia bacterium]|jgi:hypothetical protein|nr:hypothetical protein [Clostridia bacterium]